ncbi:hypothetical protein AMECASPLE_035700 [Ameca splendens]|uniref:Uncharacterized protein n=1 Tax=Ameca splendens TaxID=208324 RepID=A0ABV0ZTL7_9TELE
MKLSVAIVMHLIPVENTVKHFVCFIPQLNENLNIPKQHTFVIGRKNSLLTGRNLQQNQAQCEWPSATTDWGFERTEQRHEKKTEALIQEYFLYERNVKH